MNKRLFLLLILCASYPIQPAAIERLSLQVVCEIAEERYRRNLTAPEIAAIERHCADAVAVLLGSRIGFVDFVADEARDNRFIVKLGKTRDEADPNAIREVKFELRVSGPLARERGREVSWKFRGLAESLNAIAPDTFADEITLRFAEALANGERQLVQDQLGRLVIADSAYPMPEDSSWVLPFSREDLRLAHNSEFRINAALVFPSSEEQYTYLVVLIGDFAEASHVPPEFHHKGKALHQGDDQNSREASIARLERASEVQVRHVTISHYEQPLDVAPTAPSELDLEGAVQ